MLPLFVYHSLNQSCELPIWLRNIKGHSSGNLRTCCISTALLNLKTQCLTALKKPRAMKLTLKTISLLQDTWLNRFNPGHQDLVCLSNGKSPLLKKDDLLRAKDVGEEVYKAFRDQRLEYDPPNVKFHDTTKKAKLKTFTDLNKKIKVKLLATKQLFLKPRKDCLHI